MTAPLLPIAEFADGVAGELGASWQRTLGGSGDVILTGPDQARLEFSPGHGAALGRVIITGAFPAYRPRQRGHRITVRADRGAALTAVEIRRRLLPDYLPDLARAHSDAAAAETACHARRRLRDQLAALLPRGSARAEHPWEPDNGASEVSFHRPDAAGRIRIVGDLTMWEFRADPAIAAQLARLLRDASTEIEAGQSGQSGTRSEG